MLHIKQSKSAILLVYFSTIAITLIMSSRISAAIVSWDNYRKPFDHTIKVPLFGGITVVVNLPTDIIMDRETITLHFDIESNFFFRIDGLEQKSFEGFSPKVSVNGGTIFGNYNIYVKELPARQISKIKIKTKYLKSGKNEIEFSFGKKGGFQYKCRKGGACVGYFIHKIWFEEFGTAGPSSRIDDGLEPPRDPILRLETGTHSAALWTVDVDAESRYLVTGSNDKTVRVWDLSSHKLVKTLRPPIGKDSEGEIRAVAISPDGETIACGGITGKSWENSYCVYLFNRHSGELIRRLKGFAGSIHHLKFSKNGSFLAVGFYKGLRVYAAPAYTSINHDQNYASRCSSADFNSKKQLATGSYDGYIRLYEVSNKGLNRIAKQKAPSGTQLFSLKFSPNGSKIAVGYLKDKMSPPKIDVFSSPNLKYLYSPDTKGLKRNLEVVAWSSDGKSLYAGGYAFRAGRKVISPIFKWSGEGLKIRTRLRAARAPIQGICSLQNGGIAFIAYDTAWGIIDDQDVRVFMQRPAIAAFAGHEKGFRISSDATKVFFSYTPGFKIPAIFDVEKQAVELYPRSVDNLIWPLHEISGLDITDWRNSKNPKLNGVELKLSKNEISRRMAIVPDGSSFVLGTEWNLYRFDKKGKRIWRIAVPSVTHSVNISQDGKLIVAAIGDGTIRWYRVKDGKEILTFFPHNDRRRWIAWTPDGYYMSSPYGDELIGWHINNGKDREADFYTAMQFERILYRPDYVRTFFHNLGDQKKISKALDGEVFDVRNLSSITPPKIKIFLDEKTSTLSPNEVKLKFTAEKNSLSMLYYVVFVNNIPITPADDRILSGSEKEKFVRKVNIPLYHSNNEIRIEVFNGTSLGLAKTAIRKLGKHKEKLKGDICLVAIGVNDFIHLPDLDYAAFDAENFANFYKKKQGELFNQVYSKVISDYSEFKPFKKNIIKSLEFLKQAKAQDTVVVFLASHGLSDSAGNYFFLPKDAEPKDLEEIQKKGDRGMPIVTDRFDSLISWETFFDALRSVPGKRLLIVDTCYARKISGTLDIHSLAKRSATSSFALLAASSGNEQSQEFPQGKQGLFTYALLKGLAGNGDINTDGQVTLAELFEFITKFVENNRDKHLGKQTPQLSAPVELRNMVLSY